MTADLTALRIGDCDVYENEVLVGHTWGGVELTYERSIETLYVDKYGETPIDIVITGQMFTIKATLAQPDEENIARAIPEGNYASGVNSDKVGVGTTAGTRLKQFAKPIRLHPRWKDANDHTADVYMHQGVSSDNVELAFKFDEQQTLDITYTALVDESAGENQVLGRFGGATIS